MSPSPPTATKLDALIVGAGFSGVYQFKHLRDLGYRVQLVDSATGYGGVWHWNRYPGSRVDTAFPQYQFLDPELVKGWEWSERFPSSKEIRKYFEYVDDKWGLRSGTMFGVTVEKAVWREEERCWEVDGRERDGGKEWKWRCGMLLLNIGFAAKQYIPDWPGQEKFKGLFIHPSSWPHKDPDLTQKRVAIIGTGATAVQLIQTLYKSAGQLTVFQRTPPTAMPMKQVSYNPSSPPLSKPELMVLLSKRTTSFAGFDYNFLDGSAVSASPSDREAVYEKLWADGSFHFHLANYQDLIFSPLSNRYAYEFWRRKTIPRIQDVKLQESLAPETQPYAFGFKRIPLEMGYYEAFNCEHVELVDVNATPIEEVTEKGIRTTEKHMGFDIIIPATGYDALTGGLTQIDIRGVDGVSLKKSWEGGKGGGNGAGVRSYLGMAIHDFPNLIYTYGPLAPTALCNGPTCAEVQGDWIVGLLEYMKKNGLERIEAQKESENKWKEEVEKIAGGSLLIETKSWYMGDNIPGKKRQPLLYLGGVPAYCGILNDVAKDGYQGFDLS